MISIPLRMALGMSDILRSKAPRATDPGMDGNSDDVTQLHTRWTVCISEGVTKIGILNVSIIVSVQFRVTQRFES